MKRLLTIALLFNLLNTSFSNVQVDSFLKSVVNNGCINYELIQKEKTKQLDSLIQHINSHLINSNTQQSKAAYLNLYNLLVIKQVVANYPINSPNEIPGFFDKTKFNIKKKSTTLNELENKIIRPTYNDPRIHFALVCGAKGCPPIHQFAFFTDSLDQQLDWVSTSALNNQDFIRFQKTGTAEISEIFKWYVADFGGNEKGIKNFINKYRVNNKIESIGYYTYDWTLNDYKTVSGSNVVNYTPSVLLKKNQFEIQFFNNLYTQTAWRNDQGELQKLGSRGSWNTLMMTFNYGVSKSARFNVGFDINLRSTHNDEEDSKAIDIFKFAQNNQSRTTISTIGPKIKWNPIKKITNFSLQSAFWIPVTDSLENKSNRPWLDYDRYTWWTQLFYDKSIGAKYQFFGELDFLLRLPEIGSKVPSSETIFSTPVSIFFSYFPYPKSTIYVQYQYAPTITSYPSYYMQAGIGGKYQVLSQLQLEASYTNFFSGHTQGAGATFNVGLRYISK